MSIKFEVFKKFEYDCQDTQGLLLFYVMYPEELTFDERDEVTDHLAKCSACQDELEDLKWAKDLFSASREYLLNSGVFGEKESDKPLVKLSEREILDLRFEARLDRAGARRKRRERRERIARIKRFAKPIAAVAACLAAVLGIYLTASQLSGTEDASTPTIAAIPIETPVKIELLTASAPKIIPASQQIIASSRLKTLRINNNRHMTLNPGTELSIVPRNFGCIVKLNKGEIYTEVEHDGKPFIVETIHGRAVITGTTFNIKANDKQMELAVIEGTVRFEGDKGKVNVTAGHQSFLTANAKPTLPQLCDTGQLTTWATGINDSQEMIATTAYQPDFDLPLTFDSAEIDLECIDYKNWIEQKRSWFKQQFPHIFKFKEALAKEGIEVDYPELLIKSGDLWRFVCLAGVPARFSVINPDSLLNIASNYGFDKQWLLENIPLAKTTLDKPALSKNSFVDLKAFGRWLDFLDETKGIESPTPVYSYHASKYLANTRTLIWFAVRDGEYDLTNEERADILSLLQEEVTATCQCQNDVMHSLYEQEKPSCGDKNADEKIIEHIEIMKTIEERIARYEIGK